MKQIFGYTPSVKDADTDTYVKFLAVFQEDIGYRFQIRNPDGGLNEIIIPADKSRVLSEVLSARPPKYAFKMNGLKFYSELPYITGANAIEIAGGCAEYYLFHDNPPNKANTPISCAEYIDLTQNVSLLLVPPCTY